MLGQEANRDSESVCQGRTKGSSRVMESTLGSDRHLADGGSKLSRSRLERGRLPCQQLTWQNQLLFGEAGKSSGLEPGLCSKTGFFPSLAIFGQAAKLLKSPQVLHWALRYDYFSSSAFVSLSYINL